MKSKIATIAILLLIFTLALVIRLEPTKYGELNEFDPFWNYKATGYLIENGWDNYKSWYDDKSWYGVQGCYECEYGRNVSKTSQEGLHLTTAFLYNFYDGDLYSFVILIPAVFGALTVFPMYLLVSQLGKSKLAGLIASLFYAVTFGILLRNMAGWFKSEPLGLLLACTFLAGFTFIYYRNKIDIKIIITAVLLGLLVTFSISAWIGSAILILPILILGLVMPAFAKDTRGLGKLLLIIGTTSLIPMLFFERAESLFLPISLALMGLGAYNLFSHKLPKILRVALIFILIGIAVGGLLGSDISDRYKTIIIPFLASDNKLVSSVAEHKIPNFDEIFYMQGYYLFFAPLGIATYFIARRYDLMQKIWMFTMIGTLMYFGLTLIRLQMVMSIGLIAISAIGLVLILDFLRTKQGGNFEKNLRTVGYVLLLGFVVVPISSMWIEMSDLTPAILNGASSSQKATNEWLQAMSYLDSLPDDATVFAWWDYGYWINVLGDKATFMDNSTLWTHKITEYAKIFHMPPHLAHKELKEIGADYVLVYSTSAKIDEKYDFFTGGDEFKSFWIFEIADKKHSGLTYHFFENTLLGSMIPFHQSLTGNMDYNFIPKYASENEELFEVVYVSPSYRLDEDGIRYGILIYKVL